jgi:hypothetical protein
VKYLLNGFNGFSKEPPTKTAEAVLPRSALNHLAKSEVLMKALKENRSGDKINRSER